MSHLTSEEAAEILLKPRIERAKLDTTKSYTRIQKLQGKHVSTYVGKFVKAYTMGWGDGASLHMEFLQNGEILKIYEELWGNLNGEGMSYFVESTHIET